MQVRVGNKQDEASVRALVSEGLEEAGRSLDLGGVDSDLRNIERHYFGHDGVFLVAEDERKIIGFAAAARSTETACELRRLCVKRDRSDSEIAAQLLKQVILFARNLDYNEIFAVSCAALADQLLAAHGFKKESKGRAVLKLHSER